MADTPQHDAGRPDAISAAHGLFTAYGDAIARLDAALGAPFKAAVDLILDAGGHVVVCGMGKSGLIGRKIAATLASTERRRCFFTLPKPSMATLAWCEAAMW